MKRTNETNEKNEWKDQMKRTKHDEWFNRSKQMNEWTIKRTNKSNKTDDTKLTNDRTNEWTNEWMNLENLTSFGNTPSLTTLRMLFLTPAPACSVFHPWTTCLRRSLHGCCCHRQRRRWGRVQQGRVRRHLHRRCWHLCRGHCGRFHHRHCCCCRHSHGCRHHHRRGPQNALSHQKAKLPARWPSNRPQPRSWSRSNWPLFLSS